ncbi:MAG: response regulator [Planctomycetes bacterium]|nr:response regulator [Planctomycetota bacterium]
MSPNVLGDAIFIKSKKRFVVVARFVLFAVLCAMTFFAGKTAPTGGAVIVGVLAFLFISNIYLAFRPPGKFELKQMSYLLFVLDTAAVTLFILSMPEGGKELYLVYFLAIFVSALAKSATAAGATCVLAASIYAVLTAMNRTGVAIWSSEFAIRTVFFFITAMFIGYLAEEARREREARVQTATSLRVAERLVALFDVSQRMVSSLDVKKLQKHIMSAALEILAADSGSLMLVDPETHELRIEASVGIESDVVQKQSVKMGEGIAGWVAQKGEAVLLIGGLDADERFKHLKSKPGIGSAVCAPIKIDDRILGVVNMNKAEKATPFSDEDLKLLVTLANNAAISLEKARLYQDLEMAYETLKETRDELSTLFENANDAIVVFSVENGRILKVNHEAVRLSGFKREELLDMSVSDLSPNSHHEAMGALILHTREIGRGSLDDCLLRRKDGAVISVRISASLTGLGQREVIQLFIGDISERKQLQDQLLRSERMRALGELAGGVAHDFNNIIAAILGYAERMRRKTRDPDDDRALSIIEKSARDGAQIVRRIQDMTRLRTDRYFVDVSLNDLLEDVVAITSTRWLDQAQRQGIKIEVDEQYGTTGVVQGDEAELREAFTNIILNAVDALPEGGKIRIETGHRDNMAYVKIADNGVGMTPEVQKKVFDPLFTTKGGQGNGLGMSVSYGIITRHGGRVSVDSQPGKGTTFTAEFPIMASQPPTLKVATAAPPAKSLHTLVIDDDVRVCGALCDILRDAKHSVAAAASGEEGIRLMEEESFDVVFTDLGMPGMSGWEVARAIKSIAPKSRVVLVTGWGVQLDSDDVQMSAVDYVLTKPFTFEDVQLAIAEAFNPSGPGPQRDLT